MEEGIGILTLRAPLSIEVDEKGNCSALIVQPQMTGLYKDGRPAPMKADKPPERIPGQVILVAVGQDIVSGPFEEYGMKTKRGAIIAGRDTVVKDHPGIFAGGDCVTGPATVIRAVAAGRAAAYNIDEYLGYHHKVECSVETPEAKENNRLPTGRSNIMERPPYERKRDFWDVETSLSYEEAMQEADRCLRCDHFGCGVLKGGMDQ